MQLQVFRPSAKLTQVVYLLVLLIAAASWWAYFSFIPDQPRALLAVPALLFIWPVRMHLRLLAVKLTLDEAHLVLETGLLSKTTRTLNVGKVQDVTVNQTFGQRIFGLGDVRVETAGEGSALTAHSFDRPKMIAEQILRAAHKQSEIHGAGV
jgi:uncharacterized membrane protein YdbT with pleckstrin-like domain